ncbi:hypothetical protein M5K25_012316 [Dendrobium thyrsiflorum]|uniref:Gag-pol polyprotein n=1 Tax=Dendrobium thyrsiflorum TaxID=117978 RepID=A0ABD0UX90_DENTH
MSDRGEEYVYRRRRANANRIEDYSMLVERSRRVEMNMQNTQRRREFWKRKSDEVMGASQGSHSKSLSQAKKFNWKKTKSGNSGSSMSMTSCSKCGKQHKGECLSGTNTYFLWHQPGHIAKNCPTLGQRPPGESKMNTGPQKKVGRPGMIESAASTPGPNMITIQEKSVQILFDTGASHSFISEEFVKSVGLNETNAILEVLMPNESIMNVNGIISFSMS